MNASRIRALDIAASQVLQSASGFLMTLGFAHLLPLREFGILSGIWLAWMLVLSMNRTVFAEQLLTGNGTSADAEGYAAFSAIWITSLFLLTGIAVSSMQVWQALPGTLFVALFTASDAIRYLAMATGNVRLFEARIPLSGLELVRFLLAAGFLWLSLQFPLMPGLAWAALLPGAVWLAPVASGVRRLRCHHAWAYLRRRGTFEAFMTAQFLTVTAAAQLLPMLALPAFGAAQFGGLRLTQSIVAPAALAGTAFQPALIADLAKKRPDGQRNRTLLRTIAGFSAFSGLIVAGCFTAVHFTGHYWIPAGHRDTVTNLLLPSLVAIAFTVIGQPGGALLRVMRWGGVSLAGQAAGIAAGIVLVMVVLSGRDATIVHFAWALAGGQAFTVLITYALMFLRLTGTPAAGGVGTQPDPGAPGGHGR